MDELEGPVNVRHAGASLLQLLPGFTEELVTAVIANRQAGRPVQDMAELVALAPPTARAALVDALGRLTQAVTFVPQAWILDVDAMAGPQPVHVRLQEHLGRDGARVVVRHHRRWLP